MENTEVFDKADGSWVRLTEPTVAVLGAGKPSPATLEAVADALSRGIRPPAIPAPEVLKAHRADRDSAATQAERIELLRNPRQPEVAKWQKELAEFHRWMDEWWATVAPVTFESSWLARRLRDHVKRVWDNGYVHRLPDAKKLPLWTRGVADKFIGDDYASSQQRIRTELFVMALDELADFCECSEPGEAGSWFCDTWAENQDWHLLLQLSATAYTVTSTDELAQRAAELQHIHGHAPEEYPELVQRELDEGADLRDIHAGYVLAGELYDVTMELAYALRDISAHVTTEEVDEAEVAL